MSTRPGESIELLQAPLSLAAGLWTALLVSPQLLQINSEQCMSLSDFCTEGEAPALLKGHTAISAS